MEYVFDCIMLLTFLRQDNCCACFTVNVHKLLRFFISYAHLIYSRPENVQSPVRVMWDRTVLHKYLNPNVVAFATSESHFATFLILCKGDVRFSCEVGESSSG